ncbi:MAG: O-antigen ligase family protein [Planctomycetes bacterium]|jgi:O-antigen ligase|nr:O-antigen ligase family protein [Planctomycetota bacterium]
MAGRIWWAGVFLVLVGAPLPIGAVNTEWAMFFGALGLLLGFSAAVVGPVLERQRPVVPAYLLPLAAFAVLAALQLLPLPRFLVALASPGRAALPPVPGEAGFLPLSVAPGATLESGLLLLAAFYLAWGVRSRDSRAGLRLLLLAGVTHAALAFILLETGGTSSTRVLFVYTLPEVLAPFGSYANKNHFAGLMLIAAGAGCALLARRWALALRRTSELGVWARIGALAGRGALRLLTPVVGIAAVGLSVFASGSRGASLSLAVALVSVVLAAGLLRRRLVVLPVVMVLVLTGGGVWLAAQGKSQSVLERLVPAGRYMNRPRLWRNALDMALSYPVAGTGLGTFALAFPRHQKFAPDREFLHAESDWVQVTAEGGALGLGLLVTLGAGILAATASAWRAGGTRRALATGASVGLVAVFVHGFLDVSLHIPANLLAFGVLVGSLPWRAEDGPGDGKRRAT